MECPSLICSVRTLDWRMRHFSIYYTDRSVTVEQADDAAKQELAGHGKHRAIRTMNNKLRQKHAVKMPRDVVHAATTDLDPVGVAKKASVLTNNEGQLFYQGDKLGAQFGWSCKVDGLPEGHLPHRNLWVY